MAAHNCRRLGGLRREDDIPVLRGASMSFLRQCRREPRSCSHLVNHVAIPVPGLDSPVSLALDELVEYGERAAATLGCEASGEVESAVYLLVVFVI
jgi:hypothetical protein